MKNSITNILVGVGLTLVAAGIAGGTYVQTSLLQLFSQFGVDQGKNVGGYFYTPSGGLAFLFDYGDSVLARWERIIPLEYGNRPGSVVVSSSVSADTFEYTASGDSSLTIFVVPPLSLIFTVTDSLWRESGELRVFFDDCSPDSVLIRQPDIPAPEAITTYAMIAFNDSLQVIMEDRFDNRTRSSWITNPQNMHIYFSMIDDLRMQGPWVGPVHIQMEKCP